MVKRTLIAIVLVGLVAASAQALGPDPHPGTFDGKYQAIKVNVGDYELGWPVEYKELTLCVIPVYMNVGYYIQVEECNKRKIKLVQVDCGDIGKGSGDWPCYKDCEDIKIRSNFEAKLGVSLSHTDVITDHTQYVVGGGVVPAGENTATVCVEAWKAKLYNAGETGQEIKVGDLTVTVKPNV